MIYGGGRGWEDRGTSCHHQCESLGVSAPSYATLIHGHESWALWARDELGGQHSTQLTCSQSHAHHSQPEPVGLGAQSPGSGSVSKEEQKKVQGSEEEPQEDSEGGQQTDTWTG